MTTARCKIVDLSETRYYHCISRCVRAAFLCGKGREHRKRWIEKRLELLTSCFAISVAGFALMDNHLHILLRLDPHEVNSWTDEQVVIRWLKIYPPKSIDFGNENKLNEWVRRFLTGGKSVEVYRERLANLGWFMKSLKEPLARMANREDQCKGTFWEGRFKSIGVVNEEALLATCAYIDLNPVAAGQAETPEESKYTSIKQRIKHFRSKRKLKSLASALKGSLIASRMIGNTEEDHWLVPLEDRRPQTNARPSSKREGLVEKFTFGSYLLLVEYTGRLIRQGKARIKSSLAHIFDRLNIDFQSWGNCLTEMLSPNKRLRGHRFYSQALRK